MESENIDLQIQDVDTGYENNKKHLTDSDSKKTSKRIPEGSFIAHQQSIPWDKIEMLLYFVVLSLLVFVVAVTIIYFLKKWNTPVSDELNQSQTNKAQTQVFNTSHTLGNLSFEIDSSYKLQPIDIHLAEMTNPNSSNLIYISNHQTEAFLQKEFLEDAILHFNKSCNDFISMSGLCDLDITKNDNFIVDSVHQVFYKKTESGLDVYLIKVETQPKQILILFSKDKIDPSLINSLTNSIKLN